MTNSVEKPYPKGSVIRWQQYSKKSFDLAKKEKKPIFLLISAAWCHWCHVYEAETLEDTAIASTINNEFIPIFIDADRRRDIARRLLAGGWPTTVFFSSKGRRIGSFSGHMPKKYMLEKLVDAIRESTKDVEDKKKISIDYEEAVSSPELPNETHLKMIVETFERTSREVYDPIFGGFGDSMKFPYATTLEYILDAFLDTGDRDLLTIVLNSLDWMAKGIYDGVEGGFFRYATQRDWSAPHYEKMLSDNALLIRLFLRVYSVTRINRYKNISEDTINYIIDNLYDAKNGGFYGSQDAEEGYYKLDKHKRNGLGKPYVDKTKYCDWNSMMISSFFLAYFTLGRSEYLKVAEKSLSFLENNLIGKIGAYHYYDEEKKQGILDGQLINNAFAISAFFDAYRVTKNEKYLGSGIKILELSLNRFYDFSSFGFIERNSESKEHYIEGEEKITEKIYGENGIMASVLIEAYGFTKKNEYLERAKETIGRFMYEGIVSLEESVYFAKAAKKLLKKR